MKKWPWSKILVIAGWLLVLVGVGPLAYVFWEGSHSQALSMPLSLVTGEYSSPYFRTYLSGDYQVDLEWDRFPSQQTNVDLDWKIVDAHGDTLQKGTYSDRLRGANTVNLGTYQTRFGQRQKVIVTVHQDVEGESANARLEIGQPEISLEIGYGFILVLLWAGIVAGPGAILLCILMIRGATQRKRPAEAT